MYFSDVGDVDLATVDWHIRFDRNDQTYRMLVNVCWLVSKGLLQTQDDVTSRLMDLLDEQYMSRLYEKFSSTRPPSSAWGRRASSRRRGSSAGVQLPKTETTQRVTGSMPYGSSRSASPTTARSLARESKPLAACGLASSPTP